MKRGEIYYISHRNTIGSEIAKGRPAIIVSADALNATSDVVEVVFLTTQPKKKLPTHVSINATGTPSTALCEQISTVSKTLVGDYFGRCSVEEMKNIDRALMKSLGILALSDLNPALQEEIYERLHHPKPKMGAQPLPSFLEKDFAISKTPTFRKPVPPPPPPQRAQESDPVNHPSHYTDGRIEVIDFIEDKKLGYHLGNAVKYISRAGKKDPAKKVEDLKKAAWYINREIEREEAEE